MKIAIIGSGIAGLGAAWLLQRRYDVTLFEQAGYAGGHTNTFLHRTPDGEVPVDTGFIVYNEPCYPHLTGLFRTLGVETRASDMSFGVSIGDGAFEYAGDNLAKLFVQPANLVSPTHPRMLLQILRFNRLTRRLLRIDRLPRYTLGEFLDHHGFGRALRTRYLGPMAGAIWSTSTRSVFDYPFPEFARFFDSHGLLDVVDRPRWRTVTGGSQRYVEKMLAGFRGRLHLNAPVQQLHRAEDGAWLRVAGEALRFDAVIMACHADQALRLLADPDEAETAVLQGVPYARNRAVLHSDTRQLPKRRAAWSSWNYIGREDALNDDPVTVSYWMNRLQGIRAPRDYIVTLNPLQPPRPETVIHEVDYDHPQYTPAALVTRQRLPEIQGRRQTWYCGAWTGYGFHEDGLKSAVNVARALNVEVPWSSGG
jgi:predicted NAD/FAD-binding protein